MLPLVAIVGPTAVGKSDIGIEIAQKFQGEIISGDSMQIYRFMDIGTAKLKPAEMKGIVHHLINLLNPDDPFSVADFQRLATREISEITARNHLPIIVGGTGLYIQSVLDPYQFLEQRGITPYRKKLYALVEEEGKEALHHLLQEIDPLSAQRLHPNDIKRVIRALDYFQQTGGRSISDNQEARRAPHTKYKLAFIGLTMDRAHLYERINQRVDQMMDQGLLAEVQALLNKGYSQDLQALQGLGYRQLLLYINHLCSLAEAVELIKRDTRHFAKRQITWFKRDTRIHWFNADTYPNRKELLLDIQEDIGRTMARDVEV